MATVFREICLPSQLVGRHFIFNSLLETLRLLVNLRTRSLGEPISGLEKEKQATKHMLRERCKDIH
jgi:hypothetical protein